MKLSHDLQDTSPNVLRQIVIWKTKKGYYPSPKLSLEQALELHIALSNGPHTDEILHGTFNKVIDGGEFMIGYDGEEFIDIVVFRVIELIQRRLAQTFNDIR